MNEQQIQPQQQNVWLGKTGGTFDSARKSQFTTTNGVLTITRNGQQLYRSELATLQVSSKGYIGSTLVRNGQGEVVRLMFAPPRARVAAVGPLLILAIAAWLMGYPSLAGLSILLLATSTTIFKQVEARSASRKQFMAAVAAGGGNISAAIVDMQARAAWSTGRKIGLAVCTPLLCLVWSALIYVVAFAILQSMNLMSPESAFAPKVLLFMVIFGLSFKPTYYILGKLSDKLSGFTNIQP